MSNFLAASNLNYLNSNSLETLEQLCKRNKELCERKMGLIKRIDNKINSPQSTREISVTSSWTVEKICERNKELINRLYNKINAPQSTRETSVTSSWTVEKICERNKELINRISNKTNELILKNNSNVRDIENFNDDLLSYSNLNYEIPNSLEILEKISEKTIELCKRKIELINIIQNKIKVPQINREMVVEVPFTVEKPFERKKELINQISHKTNDLICKNDLNIRDSDNFNANLLAASNSNYVTSKPSQILSPSVLPQKCVVDCTQKKYPLAVKKVKADGSYDLRAREAVQKRGSEPFISPQKSAKKDLSTEGAYAIPTIKGCGEDALARSTCGNKRAPVESWFSSLKRVFKGNLFATKASTQKVEVTVLKKSMQRFEKTREDVHCYLPF